MRKVFYAGKGPLSPSMAIKLHSDKSVRHRHVGYALHVRVPSIEIVLEKSDIDAIQYLADDLTRVTGRVAVLSEMVTAALKQRRALSTRPSARQSLPDSWCGASLKSDVKLSDLQFLIEDSKLSIPTFWTALG